MSLSEVKITRMVCDRCGTEEDFPGPNDEDNSYWFKVNGQFRSGAPLLVFADGYKSDFCPACAAAFSEFIMAVKNRIVK